jgi:site-specific DNA-cytosine methylase
MVPGMLHVPAGQTHSPWQEWITNLSKQCSSWDIRVWPMNSAWFVPQDRARIYTVAYNRLRTSAPLPPAPTSSDTSSCPLPLAGALNLHLPPVREQPLTFQQQANLQGRKESSILQHVEARLVDDSLSFPRIATISLDRDMSAAFGDGWVRTDGRCATLRTGNELVWLLSGNPQSPWLSRCLRPLERAYLQGLPPAALAGLSKHDMLRSTGNAMTVPVVAAVLARLLNGLEPDAGLHERWKLEEEQQALAAVRATKLHHIQAWTELNRQARSEISWTQARLALFAVLQRLTQVRPGWCCAEGVPLAARHGGGWQHR